MRAKVSIKEIRSSYNIPDPHDGDAYKRIEKMTEAGLKWELLRRSDQYRRYWDLLMGLVTRNRGRRGSVLRERWRRRFTRQFRLALPIDPRVSADPQLKYLSSGSEQAALGALSSIFSMPKGQTVPVESFFNSTDRLELHDLPNLAQSWLQDGWLLIAIDPTAELKRIQAEIVREIEDVREIQEFQQRRALNSNQVAKQIHALDAGVCGLSRSETALLFAKMHPESRFADADETVRPDGSIVKAEIARPNAVTELVNAGLNNIRWLVEFGHHSRQAHPKSGGLSEQAGLNYRPLENG